MNEISGELGDTFAESVGFDPRRSTLTQLYFRITPRRIQAWPEENELATRALMRDGSGGFPDSGAW